MFFSIVQYKNVCEWKIQLAVLNTSENSNLSTEIEYFQKYRMLTNNHPTYWEDLIKADQGVSYLPIYIVKGLRQSQSKLIEPKDITPPNSFTYLIWKKESAEIDTFNRLFEEFVQQEREKVD